MSVDQATVRRVARLARIKVKDEDVPRSRASSTPFSAWIEQLNEVERLGRRADDVVVTMKMKMRTGRGDRRQLPGEDRRQRAGPGGRLLRGAEGGRVNAHDQLTA